MTILRVTSGSIIGALLFALVLWGVLVLFYPATRIEDALGYILLVVGVGGVAGAILAVRWRLR